MKTWTYLLCAVAAVTSMTACGTDGPYNAPYGTELVVNDIGSTVILPGTVMRLNGYVWNPESEQLYNNIAVTVQSSYSGVIFVPQTAIYAYSSDQDAQNWSVSGEDYYQLTEVDTTIEPNYLATRTDDHGMFDVFVYFRCLPTTCLNTATGDPYDTCTIPADAISSCNLSDLTLLFTTSVSTEYLAFKPTLSTDDSE